MLEDQTFETFADFCAWWQSLQPDEEIDMHEAATVFFDMEAYDQRSSG